MAGKELIVDDDYIRSMGKYFEKEGNRLDRALDIYLQCLGLVRDQAIPEGDTHEAIADFLNFAASLKGEIASLSELAKTRAEYFIDQIDEADQFLF